MTTLQVVYYTNSLFDLDFDLKEVHDWWVKWDTLYVVHSEGEDPEEYEPDISGADNHDMVKCPDRYFVDNEEAYI